MLKLIILISISITTLFNGIYNTKIFSVVNSSSNFTKVSPTPIGKIDIKSVNLDKDRATIICPWIEKNPPVEGEVACGEKNFRVNISTELTAEDENIEYFYTVSSGEIIGQGKNVVWRFTNSLPGNHTLTVEIGKNGISFGQKIVKTVELVKCGSCHEPSCDCTQISFKNLPKQVKADETYEIIFESEGGDAEITDIEWNVQNGEIVSGQGTNKISVKVAQQPPNQSLIIFVKVETTCPECGMSLYEKIKISN